MHAALLTIATLFAGSPQTVPLVGIRANGTTPTAVVHTLVQTRPQLLGMGAGDQLDRVQVIALRRGTIVRSARTHQGVPVLSEVLVVRFGADNQPLYLKTDFTPLPVLGAPTLSARAAARAAFSHMAGAELGARATEAEALVTRLVISPATRDFAYLVAVPGFAPWLRRSVVVDARSGAILEVKNPVHELVNDANVYEPQPPAGATLPAPTRVALERLSSATPAVVEGSYVNGLSCLTDPANLRVVTCLDVAGGYACSFPQVKNAIVALCGETHNAANQGAADGFAYPPMDNLTDYLGAGIYSDPFAEVHGYYHLDLATDFAHALGHPTPAVPLKILANVTLPSQALESCATTAWTAVGAASRSSAKARQIVDTCLAAGDGFGPLDNAFFLGDQYEALLGLSPGIYMGQGATADFAYDGAIVYHEYGHAIAAALGAFSNSYGVILDDLGMDDSPGALGEGTSDFFAAALTGDPVTGSYVGDRLGLAKGIRALDHDMVCPDYWTGEVHDDSQGYGGALWAARALYPQTEVDPVTGRTIRVFDRVVYQALATLGASPSQADAAAALVAEVAAEPDLGDPTGAATTEVLTARNILACERIRPLGATPIPVLQLAGRGKSNPLIPSLVMTPYAPGPVQLVLDVPPTGGTAQFEATITNGPPSTSDTPDFLGGNPSEPQWDVRLITRLNQPVQLGYAGNNPVTVTATGMDGLVALTATNGAGGITLAGTLELPPGATKLYAAIVNYTQDNATLEDIRLASVTANPAPAPVTTGGDEDGGCSTLPASLLAALGSVLLIVRRRR